MIDFSTIKIRFSEKQLYSFVGIQKENEDLFFYMPKGLQKHLELHNSYEIKKNLFFLLYKTFKKFIFICEDREYIHKNKANDRDGVIKFKSGSGEILDTNEPITLYNKLNFLDNLLYLYDELKILSLVYRLGSTEHIKYDRIYFNLHRANFLDNGAIYLERMNLPRPEIHFEQTDIVCLYCYLLTEIKYQLEEEVSGEIKTLAERYQEKYLHDSCGLFNQDNYENTLELVIESLEGIDRKTVYKDSDYWDFYEAIEKFLYSNLDKHGDGKIWGINNFCNVWESACLYYLMKAYPLNLILWIDDQYLSYEEINKHQKVKKIIHLDNTFKIHGSLLKPDILVINNKSNANKKNYNYLLYRDSWNDFDWYTRFYYFTDEDNYIWIRIAFEGQQKRGSITKELEKYFNLSKKIPNKIKQKDKYTKYINKYVSLRSLPDKFFSYWKLPETLKNIDLIMMEKLNHIFYRAYFIQSLKTSDDFIEKFYLKEENIILDIGSQCFGFNKDTYDEFLISINNSFSIEIIDFKYISQEEIRNKEDIEEFKCRSIRKQFVYEYLLNDYLVKKKQIEYPKISSCFWIPEYNSGEEIVVTGDEYLDGYLDLALVDPIKLLQHYVQS